ncbi:MAG: hypothetical protein GY716_18285 [bacterium]|nr:hypothetical protein [bacterium]
MRRGFVYSAAVAVVFSSILGLAWASPLTDQGTQPGLTYPIQASNSCKGCHANYDPSENLEPWNTWTGSMMAQATRDPLFWAALDVANNDVPGVGDFCLRCHTPNAWLAGRSEPPDGTVDGCMLDGKIDDPNASDFEGVSCHMCHRMMENTSPPAGEDPLYFENGQYWLDDTDCGGQGQPCRRGPYDYIAEGLTPPPHLWEHSPYHEGSGLCGNCHNVTNPVENLIIAGVDQGIAFPIERTYKEWQQSLYSIPDGLNPKTCQNCHMPDATANPSNACVQMSNDHNGDMPIHEFAGGNSWIPEVLRNAYPDLNMDAELAASRDAALDMLQNQSATVDVTAPLFVVDGSSMNATVKVTNLTGHKLPTGYPEGRRMWLNVEARDGDGVLFWESGAYDTLTGELASDVQLKVYQTKPGVWNLNSTNECDTADGVGDPIFHFVKNNCIKLDNRIPPLGFTGGSDLETQPVGYTYPETFSGSGILVNYDETDYTIFVPSGTKTPVTVHAYLRYQTASKDYVEFLLDEANDNGFADDCIERNSGLPGKTRAEVLYDFWTAYGRSAPVEMDGGNDATLILQPAPGAAQIHEVADFDDGTGTIDITYDPACGATDHTIVYGDLSNVRQLRYDDQACGLGPSGQASFNPGQGSVFWLIVGQDATKEGSYGQDSNRVERPEAQGMSSCDLPQQLLGSCDP